MKPGQWRPESLSTCTIILLIVGSLLFISSVQADEKPELSSGDILAGAVYDAFDKELDQRSGKQFSAEDKEKWRRDWLAQLLEALSQAENPELRRSIAIYALGLANGLMDRDASELLLSELAENGKSGEDSARWLAELGGLRERIAESEGGSAESLEPAKATLEAAIAKLATSQNLTPRGFNRLIRTVSELGSASVRQYEASSDEIYLTEAVRQYRRGFKAFETLRSAASAEASGAPEHMISESYTSVLKQLTTVRLDDQGFLSRELSVWALLKSDDDAMEALAKLQNLPSLRKPLEEHVVGYASSAHGRNTPGYFAFLERWLDTAPFTYATLRIRHALASSLLMAKKYTKVVRVSEPIYGEEGMDLLAQHEPAAFENKKGGTMADALVFSTQSLVAEEEKPAAISNAKTFLALFERDDRSRYMKTIINWDSKSPSRRNSAAGSNSGNSALKYLLAFNLIVGVGAAALFWARRQKNRKTT